MDAIFQILGYMHPDNRDAIRSQMLLENVEQLFNIFNISNILQFNSQKLSSVYHGQDPFLLYETMLAVINSVSGHQVDNF
jgi:hypothetical protein